MCAPSLRVAHVACCFCTGITAQCQCKKVTARMMSCRGRGIRCCATVLCNWPAVTSDCWSTRPPTESRSLEYSAALLRAVQAQSSPGKRLRCCTVQHLGFWDLFKFATALRCVRCVEPMVEWVACPVLITIYDTLYRFAPIGGLSEKY